MCQKIEENFYHFLLFYLGGKRECSVLVEPDDEWHFRYSDFTWWMSSLGWFQVDHQQVDSMEASTVQISLSKIWRQ